MISDYLIGKRKKKLSKNISEEVNMDMRAINRVLYRLGYRWNGSCKRYWDNNRVYAPSSSIPSYSEKSMYFQIEVGEVFPSGEYYRVFVKDVNYPDFKALDREFYSLGSLKKFLELKEEIFF